MKRDAWPVVGAAFVVFPRIRAGASLKHRRVSDGRGAAARFPPHSCGGLIEAAAVRVWVRV